MASFSEQELDLTWLKPEPSPSFQVWALFGPTRLFFPSLSNYPLLAWGVPTFSPAFQFSQKKSRSLEESKEASNRLTGQGLKKIQSEGDILRYTHTCILVERPRQRCGCKSPAKRQLEWSGSKLRSWSLSGLKSQPCHCLVMWSQALYLPSPSALVSSFLQNGLPSCGNHTSLCIQVSTMCLELCLTHSRYSLNAAYHYQLWGPGLNSLMGKAMSVNPQLLPQCLTYGKGSYASWITDWNKLYELSCLSKLHFPHLYNRSTAISIK